MQTKNPHRIPVQITGWAVVAVSLGAAWGAIHDPQHAGVSAAAWVAMVALYLVNLVRMAAYAVRSRKQSANRVVERAAA